MKLEEKVGEISKSGIKESGEMRIKASSKIFDALSSKIYSDKYAAVLRELGCNAYDSHVMVGKKDVPFKVKLPNYIDPELVIEDFGQGLSQAEVEDIYSTYFDSSKTNSNDVVGAFGIGSKSPFSLTDSFRLTAIKNGIKCEYSLMLNENGVPTRNLLHSCKTKEPNGVKVIVPSTSNDINKFYDAARKVFQHFEVRPEIVGQTIAFDDVEPDLVTKDYTLWKGGYYSSNLDMVALMGNVAYPVNKALLDQQLIQQFHRFKVNKLLLKFNIGELEPSLSREQLEYRKLTLDALNSKLKLFIDNCVKDLINELNNQPDFLHAIQYYLNNKELFGNTKLTYKNKDVKDFNINFYGDSTVTPAIPASYVIRYKMSYNVRLNEDDITRHFSPTHMLNGNVKFILNDKPTKGGIKPRIRHYLENNNSSTEIYLIEDVHLKLINDGLDSDYDTSLITKLSSLPVPVRAKNTGPKQVNYWDRAGSNWVRRSTKPTGGIYQPIINGYTNGVSDYYLNTVLEYLKIEAFGTNEEETKRVEKDPKWTKLKDYVTAYIDKNKDDFDIDLFINDDSFRQLKALFQFGDINNKDKDIVRLYEIYNEGIKHELALKKANKFPYQECDNIRALYSLCGITTTECSTAKEVAKLMESVYDKYPLLGTLTNKLVDKTIISKHLTEYVALKFKP